jgi:erythromycin esterase-like protein
MRPGRNEDLRSHLAEPRLERFIGVIYRPETERWSHYVDCKLSHEFDAWVWFDETTAVTPSPVVPKPEHQGGDEETWPFGL